MRPLVGQLGVIKLDPRYLESAKSCGLRGNVGYVGAWIAWARGLSGSIFYVGCVGYVGQNIF